MKQDSKKVGDYMRVCVPTMGESGLDELVGAHFGRAETFTIVDTETNEVEVVPNTSEHMGGTGLPPELLSKKNVHVMLAGGIGPKAIQMFEQYGIKVLVGATGTVRDAVNDLKEGYLEGASDENVCKEHKH